jgi:hypothetical protein
MARVGSGGAKVVGLDELRRELKRLDDAGLIGELKDVNYEVASSVIGPMKSKAAGIGAMEARAAATLSASKAAARAQVNFGGAKAPFAGGAEFGAGRDSIRSRASGSYVGYRQFNPWRGNGGDAGYFMYPTIRDRMDDIVERYGDGIEKITRKAFPD